MIRQILAFILSPFWSLKFWIIKFWNRNLWTPCTRCQRTIDGLDYCFTCPRCLDHFDGESPHGSHQSIDGIDYRFVCPGCDTLAKKV